MNSARYRFLLALLLFSAGIASFADESTDDRDAKHYVTISTDIDPADASVLEARDVRITFRAIKDGLDVTNIRLSSGVRLRAARPDWWSPEGRSANPDELVLKQAGEEKTAVFHLEAGAWWSPLFNIALLTLEPGNEPFKLSFNLQPPARRDASTPDPIPVEDWKVDVPVSAPRLVVVCGGAVGALLSALIRVVWRWRGGGRILTLKEELREAAVTVFGGALVALVLTFLGGSFVRNSIGLQIVATSWNGGIAIGLFSYILGDQLAQKIWRKERAPRPRKKHDDAAALAVKPSIPSDSIGPASNNLGKPLEEVTIARTYAELATALKVSPQELKSWKKLPGAPKPRQDRLHDVTQWRQFIRQRERETHD
jgi:hypothetical protein